MVNTAAYAKVTNPSALMRAGLKPLTNTSARRTHSCSMPEGRLAAQVYSPAMTVGSRRRSTP